MKSSYTSTDRELIRQAQLGRCAGCGQPLADNFHGHAPFTEHGSWLGGVGLCPPCHINTPTYGTGASGLYEYFYGSH